MKKIKLVLLAVGFVIAVRAQAFDGSWWGDCISEQTGKFLSCEESQREGKACCARKRDGCREGNENDQGGFCARAYSFCLLGAEGVYCSTGGSGSSGSW